MATKAKVDLKYTMKLSLNVLNNWGFNLYSNVPAVLFEVVANAYDADAASVKIKIGITKIVIEDDGHDMKLADINNKFLFVGYQRRIEGESITKKWSRPVMGRKGIGKLSLFLIANNIEIHSIKKGEKNGFTLNRFEIEKQIKESGGIYHPSDI